MASSNGNGPKPRKARANRTRTPAQSNGHSANGNGHADVETLAHPVLVADESAASETFSFTEFGNTQRFISRHGANIRYCPALGWLVYQGGKWNPDSTHLVRERIMETVLSMHREAERLADAAAQETGDFAKRAQLSHLAEASLKWARKSETANMVGAVLSLAQARLTVTHDQFDRSPWLFNLKNGTLDLRTGKLQPHQRTDYLAKQGNVVYDAEAQAPTFYAWLDQITCGDKSLAKYLQVLLGYCLTGSTDEQKFWLFYGGGRNGKTTLTNLMHYIMGDYSVEMDPKTITVTRSQETGASASPDIARLAGARFVVTSETEAGERLQTARLKRLTGATPITTRHLHKEPFEFVPEGKIIIDTNHRPNVRERSDAFWSRVRVIPFSYRIPDSDLDGTIVGRLQSESAGILNWLLQGLQEYLDAGNRLPDCSAILRSTLKYQKEQDIIDLFLNDCCVRDESAQQPSQALYDAFHEWVETQMGERAMAQRAFKSAMEDAGHPNKRSKKGVVWVGIRLRSTRDPVEGDEDEVSQ